MAKDDNLLIDGAIESAMEKIEAPKDEETTNEASSPEIEGVDDATEEAPPQESDNAENEEISDQKASVETEKPEEVQTQEAEPQEDISAPTHWTAERKALFTKASPELKKAIAEEWHKVQQHSSRLANESQRGKAWESRVNSDFESKEDLDAHKAQLRLQGIHDEVGELHNYRSWNKVMRHDPVTAVRALINQFQITPDELNGETLSEEQERYVNDPRVDNLIEEMKKERESREASEKQAQHEYMASKVNTWKSGNDKYGKPRSDFAGMYAPQIDNEWQRVLQEAQQTGENLSLEQSLDRAYNNVQSQVYKTHGINPNAPKQSTPEQKAAQAAKVQAAVTKASGVPRSEQITKKPRKEYKNDKERIEAAVSRAESKISSTHR